MGRARGEQVFGGELQAPAREEGEDRLAHHVAEALGERAARKAHLAAELLHRPRLRGPAVHERQRAADVAIVQAREPALAAAAEASARSGERLDQDQLGEARALGGRADGRRGARGEREAERVGEPLERRRRR